MNTERYLPLTETTFYILISLINPEHGYSIMKKVEKLSSGKVRIAAGTMYGALVTLSKLGWIISIPSKDKRRKVYQITSLGLDVLRQETHRLKYLVKVAEEWID